MRPFVWKSLSVGAAAAWAVCLCLAGAAPGQATGGAAGKPSTTPGLTGLRRYETKYYIIYTDIAPDAVREATVRVTSMADEYSNRTRGFSGSIKQRFPLYLFSKPEDYYAAGGPKTSNGMYDGRRLMAIAATADRRTWRVLQHEGFHQFAHLVITGRLPIWVNEGLAEYFAEGIWTGDAMVTGLVSPYRLAFVQAMIRAGSEPVKAGTNTASALLPFRDMLMMTHAEWSKHITGRNYQQAWSMVHFLGHADEGKYQGAFVAFINDVAVGKPADQAFSARIGSNIEAFQKRYEEWWLGLGGGATRELHAQAVVQALTSFLARASMERQKFSTAQEFLQAAADGELKCPDRLWLPPSLARSAAKAAEQLKEWSIERSTSQGKLWLVLKLADGTVFRGEFSPVSGNDKLDVKVTIERAKAAPGPSKTGPKPASAPARSAR